MRILPHQGRLQEWVADERGYFTDEGLEYDFGPPSNVLSTERDDAGEIKSGAYEVFEAGRDADISCACHWAVNTATANQLGKLVSNVYAVTPSAIVVAPESPITRVEQLAGVEVGVGYHSGSHFATLQALEAVLDKDDIKLSFEGTPAIRLDSLIDRSVAAATLWGPELYIAQSFGFRVVLDTTFMIAFHAKDFDVDPNDVEKYFNGLKRAQMEIDLHGERYKHYFLKSIPQKYHDLIDVRQFGPGERLVFLPYTGETYESTQAWIQEHEIFGAPTPIAAYESILIGGPTG